MSRGCVGVVFLDGRFSEILEPRPWAFWKGGADVRVVEVDLREVTSDVTGQEIMSADKVTLRLNAVAAYRVTDPRRAVCATDDDQSRPSTARPSSCSGRSWVPASSTPCLSTRRPWPRRPRRSCAPRAEGLGLRVSAFSSGISSFRAT